MASPRDLGEERKLVREAVDEINRVVAAKLGFRVELKGWEETHSGIGRPQELINAELDLCELFIGMMWRKWGSRPTKTEGKYSSGFEEEFERSLQRREETCMPEMSMYFKEIDESHIEDPGDDLKKVLNFKKRLEEEKFILFETFSDPFDFQRKVRLKIENYLFELKEKEESETEQEIVKQEANSSNDQNIDGVSNGALSPDGRKFLDTFIQKLEEEEWRDEISQAEVARFRLLACAVKQSGNDKSYLGVHDANIIYKNKNDHYGRIEISELINAGLRNFNDENIPLWHWYNLLESEVGRDFLPFKSINWGGVGVGALKVMRLIGAEFPNDPDPINRSMFVSNWFSKEAPDSLKVEALRFLKHQGKVGDLSTIERELERSDFSTLKYALEALVSIQYQSNKLAAAKTTLQNQFENFDENLLAKIVEVLPNLDEEFHHQGIAHRNSTIRLECCRKLIKDDKLTIEEINELKKDVSASIRNEIVLYLQSCGHDLSDQEVKGILIKPQNRNYFSALGFAAKRTDKEGEAYYEEYLFAKNLNMSEHQLRMRSSEEDFLRMLPYFALCKKYFKKYGDDLRKDIDDQFKEKFDNKFSNLKKAGAPDKTLQSLANMEKNLRAARTREGLDILCEKGCIEDLARIRKFNRSDFVSSSKNEIRYFKKYGEWEDLPHLANAEKFTPLKRSLLEDVSGDAEFRDLIASAMYSIGNKNLNQLVELEMSPLILANLLRKIPTKQFSILSMENILNLLGHKDEQVRKITSLKCVISFSKSWLRSTLSNYLNNDNQHFYNVIFWLDLGVSMKKSLADHTAKIVLNEDVL
ncbi:hypothetical protein [Emcibacter sp.]|uniref:hypothetical protein n=1 Tax=Emcibacter sp. TaxID=1979954 RepID=UPI002AA95E6B|nr:hypothetical protein [Emcibacter sp.]